MLFAASTPIIRHFIVMYSSILAMSREWFVSVVTHSDVKFLIDSPDCPVIGPVCIVLRYWSNRETGRYNL